MGKDKKPKIFFILPGDNANPGGGLKIAYVYADYLASRGYDVTILCVISCILGYKDWAWYHKLGLYTKHIVKIMLGWYHPASWYKFKNNVRVKIAYTVKHLPIGSKLIFTGYQDLDIVKGIKEIPNKDKFYFIQGYETWFGATPDEVDSSYRLGYNNMVVATWLLEKVESAGAKGVLLPNGFDFDYFKLENPIESRHSFEISMLYSEVRLKCCDVAFAALKKVKEWVPELHVTMFGTFKEPADMPSWFTYYHSPDKERHNEIYNNAAIFVAASSVEGFGLTVGEAMICGSAICCTDTGGFRMMVKDKKTGLISPVGDVDSLAKNILTLIKNNDMRIKLAKAGNAFIQQFTWQRSFDKLEKLLS